MKFVWRNAVILWWKRIVNLCKFSKSPWALLPLFKFSFVCSPATLCADNWLNLLGLRSGHFYSSSFGYNSPIRDLHFHTQHSLFFILIFIFVLHSRLREEVDSHSANTKPDIFCPCMETRTGNFNSIIIFFYLTPGKSTICIISNSVYLQVFVISQPPKHNLHFK
jgi:hypothetical protein